MTNEEAKTVFLNWGYVEVEGRTEYDADKWREACRIISEWLEQEPCDDCISRQAVLEIQVKYAEHMGATKYWQMRDDIRALPSVTQKSGKWIIIDDCEHFMAKCSECGEVVDSRMINDYPYCHCGAKMQAESEDKE